MIFFLKGIIIGIVCGVPVGAIGTLCIQRSLSYGFRSGIITGLGSSAADCFYAAVSIFGISLISDFITRYQTIINAAGGILIMLMGISVLSKKQYHDIKNKKNPSYISMFVSSLGIGIINPAVFIMLMFVCSYAGINSSIGIYNDIISVAGIFAGTMIWWIILSMISGSVSRRCGSKGFARMNMIFGTVMIGFGVLIFIKLCFA